MTIAVFPKEVKRLLGRLTTVTTAYQQDRIENQIFAEHTDSITYHRIFKAIVRIGNYNYKPSYQYPERVLNHWKRHDEESWRQVFILNAENEEHALNLLRAHIYVDGYGSSHPGHSFARPAIAHKIHDNRYMVTQRGGLDV